MPLAHRAAASTTGVAANEANSTRTAERLMVAC